MAKIYGQLEKAQLENTTSDTGSLPKGMITYRTDLNLAKVSDGTSMLALIDESSAQTLSNKTYATPVTTGAIQASQVTTPANPSAGNNKLYFKADGKLYTLDSSGNEAAVGSGSGGVKNLITNGNADDTASSIFVPYADTGTRPVDGTGGSPTVTTSITTTAPLDGVKSFLLTKPASNVQGQGWAVPFSVDPAYRAKALKISADFIVNSGTFVAGTSSTDGDLIWYIYDVTNSQLIEPSNIKMLSSNTSIADKFEATFQSSATGSSYRLIAHVASTSALAFEIKVDNVTVGPQNYVFGTPVTDWVSYTPTVSGLGSGSGTVNGRWRRLGDSLEVTIDFTKDGTPGSGTSVVNFSLPSGITVDTNKIGATGSPPLGFASTFNLETSYDLSAVLPFTGNTAVQLTNIAAGAAYQGSNFGAGAQANMRFTVPVVGLSSSVQMSDSADTRVVAASISSSTTTSVANSTNTKVAFQSISVDTHGGWDTSNNRYNVRVAGKYSVASLLITAASTAFGANSLFSALLYKNGVQVLQLGWVIGNGTYQFGVSGNGIVDAKVGDYFEIFCFQTSGASINLLNSLSHVDIQMIQGPSAIAANEALSLKYKNSAGTVLSNGTTVPFATKDWDSHALWTSNTTFTAPTAGKYRVSAVVNSTAFTPSAGNIYALNVHKNGTSDSRLALVTANAAVSQTVVLAGAAEINCVAGDTLSVVAEISSGSITLAADVRVNQLFVERIS